MRNETFVLRDALEGYARLVTLWANMSDSERDSPQGQSVAKDYYKQYLAITEGFTRLSVDCEVSLVSLRRKDAIIKGLELEIEQLKDSLA